MRGKIVATASFASVERIVHTQQQEARTCRWRVPIRIRQLRSTPGPRAALDRDTELSAHQNMLLISAATVSYSPSTLGRTMFALNPQSGTPIYRQLIDQVRRLIAAGQLTAGTELPSVRELALTHAVNPNTISKAYTLLEAEGLLERHRGKNMTVSSRVRATSDAKRRTEQIEPQVDQLIFAARQLGLEPDELIALVRKKWRNRT